jgi:hypothetical protein
VKKDNLQWFGINHLANEKIMDPQNFFAELFSSSRIWRMFVAKIFRRLWLGTEVCDA